MKNYEYENDETSSENSIFAKKLHTLHGCQSQLRCVSEPRIQNSVETQAALPSSDLSISLHLNLIQVSAVGG